MELFSCFVLKTDTRNVTSGVERMLVGVPVAVLHKILKTRVNYPKLIGNATLTTFIC